MKIDSSGITLMGGVVKINQGGFMGSCLCSEAPKVALEADRIAPLIKFPEPAQNPATQNVQAQLQ